MAVGDVSMPQMHVVKGVKIGSAEAYVRYQNRRDLVIFELAEGSNVAGVFTQNAFCAAPVRAAARIPAHAACRGAGRSAADRRPTPDWSPPADRSAPPA